MIKIKTKTSKIVAERQCAAAFRWLASASPGARRTAPSPRIIPKNTKPNQDFDAKITTYPTGKLAVAAIRLATLGFVRRDFSPRHFWTSVFLRCYLVEHTTLSPSQANPPTTFSTVSVRVSQHCALQAFGAFLLNTACFKLTFGAFYLIWSPVSQHCVLRANIWRDAARVCFRCATGAILRYSAPALIFNLLVQAVFCFSTVCFNLTFGG